MDDNWTEALPEALRDAPFFKPGEDGAARTVEQVMADLSNAAQHMGNSIRIPGPDASEDDVASFQTKALEKIPGLMAVPNIDDVDVMAGVYSKMGRPGEAKDYVVPDIEGHSWEGLNMEQIQERAFTLGMSQKQYTSMLTDMANDTIAVTDTNKTSREEALTALKGEWGAAFDQRMAAVTEMVNAEGAPPELKAAMESGEIPTGMVKWIYNLAESISGEGGETSLHGKGGEAEIDPEEAEKQIAEIMNRPEYWDPSSPQQGPLKAKIAKLSRLASPGAATEMNRA